MKNAHKNSISFLLGSSFAYIFVWLISVVASMPVPKLLQPYNEFLLSYYSNILTVTFTVILSGVVMLLVRKAFISFTRQNLFYFALPISLFSMYLLVFLNFAVEPLMYAVIPTLSVALLLSSNVQKI